MKKSTLKPVPPKNEKQIVDMARRRPNAELRQAIWLSLDRDRLALAI